MGTLQFLASGCDSRSSENSVTALGPYCEDMDSTPLPMPISIMPERMALAMSEMACRPLLHCRFRLFRAVVSGKPATRAAALNSVAPEPGARTLPTAMSSTRAGFMFERSMTDLRVCARRSAPGVSLKPPRPPFVRGVRRAQVTTMSSSFLARRVSRPRGMSASEEERWEVTCERRWRAGTVSVGCQWSIEVLTRRHCEQYSVNRDCNRAGRLLRRENEFVSVKSDT